MEIASRTLSTFALTIALADPAPAQPVQPPAWSGWARCEVSVQGPGYSDRQTHTWTMTGGTPTVEGAFRTYPGTWNVVGGGSLQRTQGTQSLMAQWATNVAGMSAPLAVFVRASDGRMFISARHAQLRSAGAITGYQQLVIDGKPQTPGRIAAEAFEWAFPMIDVDPKLPTASGSKVTPVSGSVGPMQPAGSQVTASCSWQFGQGAAAPAPPPPLVAQSTPTPPPPGTSASAPGVPGATGTIASGGATDAARTAPPAPPPPPTLTSIPLAPGALATPQVCSLRGPTIDNFRPPYVSPGRVNIGFNYVAGATGYTVSRADRGLLTPTPIPPSRGDLPMYFDHQQAFSAPLDYTQTYVYSITALYPQGCGSTTFNVTPPWPNAAKFIEVLPPSGPGRVGFRAMVDDPQRDFTGMLVKGPGLPVDGRIVMSAGNVAWPIQLTIDGVPAGTRTWTFTTFYDIPGGRVLDVEHSTKSVTVSVP
jgi:hypothetical protein